MNKKYWIILLAITILAAILRIVSVVDNPPGLYIDEVSNAYNAHLILTTGHDEHGVSFPMWFKAFGEYKMPVMIYMIAGAMAIFGKTDVAVRLPSILFGILTIPAVFFLVKESLIPNSKLQNSNNKHIQNSNKGKKELKMENGKWGMEIALLSAFFLAISPWHIHFSRAGFEATIALFFIVASIVCFFKYNAHGNVRFLGVSMLLAVLAVYTYNTYRIIVPLLVVVGVGIMLLRNQKPIKHLTIGIVCAAILLTPMILFSFSSAGSERFAQTSAFSQFNHDSLTEKLYSIPMVGLKNYLSFFSTNFLFNSGDYNGRHQVPGFGLLFKWQMIAIIAGGITLALKREKKLSLCILILLLLAPLPAALTVPAPHTLRSLMMVIPLSMIGGVGLFGMKSLFTQKKKIFLALFALVAIGECIIFGHFYALHYSKINILDWGAGYKDMVVTAEKHAPGFDVVLVDTNMGSFVPLYFAYYGKSVTPQMVDTSWLENKNLQNKKVLLIRPDYREPEKKNRIDMVTLPNLNKDIFAEFYSL